MQHHDQLTIRHDLASLLARVIYRIPAPQNVLNSPPIALPDPPVNCSLSTVVNANLSVEKQK